MKSTLELISKVLNFPIISCNNKLGSSGKVEATHMVDGLETRWSIEIKSFVYEGKIFNFWQMFVYVGEKCVSSERVSFGVEVNALAKEIHTISQMAEHRYEQRKTELAKSFDAAIEKLQRRQHEERHAQVLEASLAFMEEMEASK